MKRTLFVFVLLLCALSVQANPLLWDEAGLAVRQGNHLRWDAATAQDASGNAITVWADARGGVNDVYAQLVNSQGDLLWTGGGVNVCNAAPGRQESPAVCVVDGGFIVTWFDYRTWETGAVWAQKLDINGHRVWTDNDATGMPVNDQNGWSNSLRAVDDGNGGALIAWIDESLDPGNIFAQHIQSSGNVAEDNPVPICTADHEQSHLQAASDGQGNMLLVWRDHRDMTNWWIYAAKLTSTGDIPWGADGTPVCESSSFQYQPQIAPDGSHGCFIAWQDARNETSNFDLYMQRLNADGAPQFAAAGIVLAMAAHDQKQVRLATSIGEGGAVDGCLTVWEDQRVNDYTVEVYAQKISLNGTVQWAAGGIRICGDAGPNESGHTREEPRLVSDRAGGLVCAWEDTRDTSSDITPADIYAARVLASGTLGWNGECGNLVADGVYGQRSPVVSFTSSGVLVHYLDRRSGSQSIRVQELGLASGSRLFPPDGIAMQGSIDFDISNPQLLALDLGRTAVVWEDYRSNSYSALYYQILTGGGRFERNINGERLVTDNTSGDQPRQSNERLCADGSGGFFVVWEDLRTTYKSIRAIHVNSGGEIVSNPAGEEVWRGDHTTDQIYAYCASDGQGGLFVAWSDFDQNFVIDAYVMRLDAQCLSVWQNPARLTNTPDDDMLHGLVSNPDGCCFVVWTSGSFQSFDISVARVCGDGTVTLNGTVCNAADEQLNPVVVADGFGGAFFAWDDKRLQEIRYRDVYAQHLNAEGTETWPHNGLAVCIEEDYQGLPAIAVSGEGDLYVVWQNLRDQDCAQLYGQRISSDGNLLWDTHGLLIAGGGGDQTQQVLMRDSGSGLFLAWVGSIDSWPAAMATHLGTDGAPIGDPYWVEHVGGSLTTPIHQWQWTPAMVSDGAGGAVIAWTDQRSSGEEPLKDLYAQHIADAAGVDHASSAAPKVYALSQNYPNPFNPSTRIAFALPKSGHATLKIFDLMGREVATLLNNSLAAGDHAVTFNAGALPSGVYFYRLEAGSFTATRKLLLLK